MIYIYVCLFFIFIEKIVCLPKPIIDLANRPLPGHHHDSGTSLLAKFDGNMMRTIFSSLYREFFFLNNKKNSVFYFNYHISSLRRDPGDTYYIYIYILYISLASFEIYWYKYRLTRWSFLVTVHLQGHVPFI